ncbi:MmcQ/YjbR family DNA-binding protein [Pseudomonas entomophila]|uniref:MmcQ/YjbR family DNA-binding protein n=1 Tax=Pseudomonas entomophila TaxID=312306 RepID=UPI0023D85386|nr:MmcQ/YjbR family DNA-binding protein [Pseudomonas entomophila]MDF0732974.1 MmcQ/YjbR family DNA-binding protein [Pseudomonas entomophila]
MSKARMTEEQVAQFCLSLPGAREDYKWGGIRVFSVAGNKMFALLGLAGGGLAFKVADELFLGYCDRPGVRPAPYLARAKWVSMEQPYPMGREELTDLLQRSHQLVVRRLPKRLQVGLLSDT